jgi:hypothetical protein
MPNTAVNMNEMRKKRVKNGMRTMIKSERKMKSNGRRRYQAKRKSVKTSENPYKPPKIFTSLFPTNLPTVDVTR